MNKVLIVVDMQNDFINGSLANSMAENIVEPIANYIREFDGIVVTTQDTHFQNYLNTYEGKHLPIEHCVKHTFGWEIENRIKEVLVDNTQKCFCVKKYYFNGAEEVINVLFDVVENVNDIEQVEFVGTATEVCVISTLLGLKPLLPNANFIVHANMCVGLTQDGHESALKVMKACQVQVL